MELEFMKDATENVIGQIAHSHGFTNPRLEFSSATKPSENFMGSILRCVLTDNNSKKILRLIVKLPPSENRRKLVKFEGFFNKEAYMYDTVLPTLANCYKRKKLLPDDALFPCTARCVPIYSIYFIQNVFKHIRFRVHAILNDGEDKLIVMEDLKERGFVMKDRYVGLDETHCRFVLRQLARLHAASLALQKDNPKLHSSLTDNLPETLIKEEIHSYIITSIEKFRKAIDDRFPLGSPVRNKVESFLENYFVNMNKMIGTNSQLCCITHSDLWVNNILFKYHENADSIEDMCFLDFQISRFCSPVTDIWHFFAMCTRRSTRKSYKELVKCYYESLCYFLEDLGHNPEDIVPYDLLKKELRKYACFGWAMGIAIFPAAFLQEEDMMKLEEMKRASTSFLELPEIAKAQFIELLEEAEEFDLFWN